MRVPYAAFQPVSRRPLFHPLPSPRRRAPMRAAVRQPAAADAFDAFDASAASLADAVGAAVFAVDGDSLVLSANARAVALCGADSPLCLRGGRLVQAPPHATPTLAALVRAAAHEQAYASGERARYLCLARLGRLPLTLRVQPWPRAAAGTPCALVIACDPCSRCVSLPALRQLFGLTQAEAALAAALAQGAPLEAIAALHGVSVNTLKTHLRHVFGKTATKRQGELIALLHGSAAMLEHAAP